MIPNPSMITNVITMTSLTDRSARIERTPIFSGADGSATRRGLGPGQPSPQGHHHVRDPQDEYRLAGRQVGRHALGTQPGVIDGPAGVGDREVVVGHAMKVEWADLDHD